MAHGKQRHLKGGADRFVALTHFMLKSAAWKTMSPAAKALLIEVWQRHNGINNGEISYSIREARAIGLTKSRAARAFAELLERGFLKVKRASAFTLKTKEARTWYLTAERADGEPATKEFMRWRPDTETRTQSHQRDRQSPSRDTGAENPLENASTVPPAGPSGTVSGGSQSHQRDTSNYTMGGCGEGGEARSHRARSASPPDLPPSALGPAILLPSPVVRVPFVFDFDRCDTRPEPCEAGRQHDGPTRRVASRPLPITPEQQAADLAELHRQRDVILADIGTTP